MAAQSRAIHAALVLGASLRLWFAVTDHSIFWPDEIYQSIEPAHRLVFGYGLLPWEFRDGARSWSFPGLLAVPLKLLGLLHLDSGLALVVAARLVMVVLAVAAMVVGIEYARRLGGKSAALIAAWSQALFPPLLAYSHRTLQEAVSAPFVLVLPLLLLGRSQRGASWAGLAAGVATLLRFQCGVIGGVFAVALLLERNWADLRAYAKSGSAVLLAGGLLDWFTWGRPFHSFVTYVHFNLVRGGASTFGMSPAGYFARTLWTSSGPAVLLVGLGVLVIGVRVARASAAAVLVFVVLHSAIPHKEFRFILPVLPLALSLGAAGLARVLERTVGAGAAPAQELVAGILGLAFARSAHGARYEDFGQDQGSEFASGSVWHSEEQPNLLLNDAAREPDLCGVLMLGVRAAFTGGYSYLHRNVPLMYRFRACDEAKAANYIIAKQVDPNVPPSYQIVRTREPYALFKRPGVCEPPSTDLDGMLDGADDMGLARAPIHQPDPQELRIQAGANAAAFVSGFGNGEHLDCRDVRWAVARKARMAFPLEPTGATYSLGFTAQPYGRALPQAVSIALNDHKVADFELAEGWHGYQAFVSNSALRRGKNVLDFTFARAQRAEGDDTRTLAVLFDQVALSPVNATLAIRAGADDSRQYLSEGFSGNERDGKLDFVWTVGPKSRLTVTVPEARAERVFQIVGRAYGPVAPLDVAVSMNDQPVGTLTFGAATVRASLLVPTRILKQGTNAITLAYSRTARPSDREPGSTDQRQLALRCETILLTPLTVLTRLHLGLEEAHPLLRSGWSNDESSEGRRFVWNDGAVSSIQFAAPPSARLRTLRVRAQGFEPALPLVVTVLVNGKTAGNFRPTNAWDTYQVAVPSDLFTSGANVLEFAYSRTARPKEVLHNSDDTRQLAVRFETVELTEGEPGTGAAP